MHGTVAGISSELTLALGEFITRIEGTFVGNLFPKIEFWTSKGECSWSPLGVFIYAYSRCVVQEKSGVLSDLLQRFARLFGMGLGPVWDCCISVGTGAHAHQ